MKNNNNHLMRLITLFVLSCLAHATAKTQDWTGWQTVYSEGQYPNEVKVQVSFKVKGCRNSPYSFFRTNNEFSTKGNVKFTFDYIDCDGKNKEEHVLVDLEKKGIDQYIGNWFIGASVGQIHDIKTNIYNKLNTNQDIKSKLKSLYDSWKKDLADATLKYNGYAGIPNPLSVTREWGENIQEAKKRVDVLKDFINNYTGKQTAELQQKFNDFNAEYQNFQTSSSNYQTQIKKATNSSTTSSNWIKLPDNTFYKILPDGMYSFWDGLDQIETMSALDGKKELLKHQKLQETKVKKKRTAEEEESLRELRSLVDTLKNQIKELKDSGVDTSELDKQMNELQKQIDELEKDE